MYTSSSHGIPTLAAPNGWAGPTTVTTGAAGTVAVFGATDPTWSSAMHLGRTFTTPGHLKLTTVDKLEKFRAQIIDGTIPVGSIPTDEPPTVGTRLNASGRSIDGCASPRAWRL